MALQPVLGMIMLTSICLGSKNRGGVSALFNCALHFSEINGREPLEEDKIAQDVHLEK